MDVSTLYRNLSRCMQCAVCLYAYDKPMALGCGHIFCHTCIQSLHRVCCPLCKKRSRLKPRNIHSITSIIDIVDELFGQIEDPSLLSMVKLDYRPCHSKTETEASCSEMSTKSLLVQADQAKTTHPEADMDQCLKASKVFHSRLMDKVHFLDRVDTKSMDLMVYFDDRELLKCAIRQWGAICRNDSIFVGAEGKTKYCLCMLPDTSIRQEEGKDSLHASVLMAPTSNPHTNVLYISYLSSRDTYTHTANSVARTTICNSYSFPNGDNFTVSDTTIIPLNDHMLAWHRSYSQYLEKEIRSDTLVNLEVADVRRPVFSSRMIHVLQPHHERVSRRGLNPWRKTRTCCAGTP